MKTILAIMCACLAMAASQQKNWLLMAYWLMVMLYWLINRAKERGK